MEKEEESFTKETKLQVFYGREILNLVVGEIIKRKLVKREMDNPINTMEPLSVEEIDIQVTDRGVLEKLTPFAVCFD